MKIAIATEENKISGHFGRCENFTIVELKEELVVKSELVNTQGNLHGSLPKFLKSLGVDVVISGGMGSGAMQSLHNHGIKIYTGVQGLVEDAVQSYSSGLLISSEALCEEHKHQDGNGHECSCSCH